MIPKDRVSHVAAHPTTSGQITATRYALLVSCFRSFANQNIKAPPTAYANTNQGIADMVVNPNENCRKPVPGESAVEAGPEEMDGLRRAYPRPKGR
jgi:hypothetical protein